MIEWLKTLIGGICILTILLNLLPDGKFTKYVRFYAGLIFFLMAVSPVLRFFAGAGELERLLELEFLREDYYDLETAVEGMSDLKNDYIQAACQNEILRQIEEIASAYGLPGARAEAAFDPSDGWTPTQIRITVPAASVSDFLGQYGRTAGSDGRTQASGGTGSLDTAGAQKALSEAAGDIRREISSVYGLEMNRISVTEQGGRQL